MPKAFPHDFARLSLEPPTDSSEDDVDVDMQVPKKKTTKDKPHGNANGWPPQNGFPPYYGGWMMPPMMPQMMPPMMPQMMPPMTPFAFPPPMPFYYPPMQQWKAPETREASDEEDDNTSSNLYWKNSSLDEPVPKNAIVGGRDTNGRTIYIGKAKFMGDELPVKVIPESDYAALPYGGREHSIRKYKILCQRKSIKWVKCRNGQVPKGAVVGGVTCEGEKLYVGRAPHKGSLTIGKVHGSRGCLFLPFEHSEHSYKEYEVMVEI